jgi:hypothetical protein
VDAHELVHRLTASQTFRARALQHPDDVICEHRLQRTVLVEAARAFSRPTVAGGHGHRAGQAALFALLAALR